MSGFAAFKGHLGRVSPIAFSPDGERVATGGYADLTIRIWSVKDGSLEAAFSFGELEWLKSIDDLVFSPDGETLYVAIGWKILAWIPATREIAWRRKMKGIPTLSPDGRMAVIRLGHIGEECLRFFDLKTRRYRGDRKEGWVPDEFSPDGRFLRVLSSEWSESGNKETALVDVKTREIVWRNEVPCHTLFLNATTLAVLNRDSEAAVVTLLSLPSLEAREEPIEFRHWELLGEWSEGNIVTAKEGTRFLRGAIHDPALRIEGNDIRSIDPGVSYDTELALSPDERWVAIGDHAGCLRLVDFEDGSAVWRTPSKMPVSHAVVSNDSRRLAVRQGRRFEGRSLLWDLEHLVLLGEMEEGNMGIDRFEGWRFDRTLRWLGKEDRWPAEDTPLGLPTPLGHAFTIYRELTIEFTNEGEEVSVHGETWDGDQIPIPKPEWGDRKDQMRTLSHNGRWMGVAGADDVYVVDVETRKRVHSMPYPSIDLAVKEADKGDSNYRIVGLAISEDGTRLATGSTSTPFDVLVFDFARKTVRERRVCCDAFTSLAFHPSGDLLAVGDGHQEPIVLIDLARRRRNRELERHVNVITSLDFTPDGRWLVSAASDGQVILWNATTCEPEVILMILSHPEEPLRWAVLTPDGHVKGSPGVASEFL